MAGQKKISLRGGFPLLLGPFRVKVYCTRKHGIDNIQAKNGKKIKNIVVILYVVIFLFSSLDQKKGCSY